MFSVFVFERRTANSSPPIRATRSPFRKLPWIATAALFRSSSPAMWPSVSLMSFEAVDVADEDSDRIVPAARKALYLLFVIMPDVESRRGIVKALKDEVLVLLLERIDHGIEGRCEIFQFARCLGELLGPYFLESGLFKAGDPFMNGLQGTAYLPVASDGQPDEGEEQAGGRTAGWSSRFPTKGLRFSHSSISATMRKFFFVMDVALPRTALPSRPV